MRKSKEYILTAVAAIGIILLLASHWINNPIVTFIALSICLVFSIFDYRERKRNNTNVKWGIFYMIMWGVLWLAQTHDLTQYIWHDILNK